MAITLSHADYNLLWQQANPSQEKLKQAEVYEVRSQVPKRLGKGHIQEIQWHGIRLSLFNYQLHEDVFVQQRAQDEDGLSREIGFNLSGNRFGKRTGENFIEWGHTGGERSISKTYANEPIRKVDIHIESSELLVQMVNETLCTLPKSVLQQIKEGSWICEVNSITPAMRIALDQLLRCPFYGETRRLFLESKCLELIALKLEQLKTKNSETKPSCLLRPDDVERIHYAKDILTKHSDYPPSLTELARQVNLNDYKLKVGFKQVFGTTVFGYLRQYRMTEARRMLFEQQMNVKEVSRAVGYANQSQFAAAFRKQFGINPKAYVLSIRS